LNPAQKPSFRLCATAALVAVVLCRSGAGPEPDDRAAANTGDRVLFVSSLDPAAHRDRIQRLREALDQAGAETRHVTVIHRRISEDREERVAVLRAMLLEDPSRTPAVVVPSLLLAQDVRRAHATVPIVFDAAGDPVRVCLVDHLARPATATTGYTSWLHAEPKMMEALLDTFETLRHVIVLVDGQELHANACVQPTTATPAVADAAECTASADVDLQAAERKVVGVDELMGLAHERGVGVSFVRLCSIDDVDLIDEALRKHPSAGIVVPWHQLFATSRRELAVHLSTTRAPTVYPRKSFLDAGGALALSPMIEAARGTTAAAIVVQILQGRPPATIPVQMPRGFELSIDVAAVERTGLRPSLMSLRRADEIRQ
jgi:ABC-type uncharacterized transport system substrate-binding protein